MTLAVVVTIGKHQQDASSVCILDVDETALENA